MPRDETLSAGRALRCGDTLLVPVLRATARSHGGIAFDGEAELVGLIARAPAQAGRFLALAPLPSDADSWSAWLEAHPALLAEIRRRLDAAD